MFSFYLEKNKYKLQQNSYELQLPEELFGDLMFVWADHLTAQWTQLRSINTTTAERLEILSVCVCWSLSQHTTACDCSIKPVW